MKKAISAFVVTLMMLSAMLTTFAGAVDIQPMRFEPCSCGGAITEYNRPTGYSVFIEYRKCDINERFNCKWMKVQYERFEKCASCGKIYTPVETYYKNEFEHDHSGARAGLSF